LNKIQRAEKAQRILDDELFKESFESVRLALLQKFESAPIGDADGIMKVRLCLKLLTDVRANLEAVIRDGKVEEFNIQEKKRLFNFRR
jgi:hypothetical protein